MEQEQQWRKLSGERIKVPVAEEISRVLMREKEMGHELKVCIGTDSQVKGKITEFATVIVFIRKGKGGFMYIHNETTHLKMTIKQRMLTEVAKSIEVAYSLCNIFSRFGVAMGYIVGMGFAFKAKPEAFASSSCANKVVQ